MWRQLTAAPWRQLAATTVPMQQLAAGPTGWAASLMRRSIITVTVHTPSDWASQGSPEEFNREVAKCEDIAMGTFNRIAKAEKARGTVRGGSRGQRRWYFWQKPTEVRTAKGAPGVACGGGANPATHTP